MKTKSKKITSLHGNDENKSNQQQVKELLELIEENNTKSVGSWLENCNDSQTLVCSV